VGIEAKPRTGGKAHVRTGGAAGSTRRPRADSQRNRRLLLEAAKAAFGEVGPQVSLDEIARRAGVGIGTLYRHFRHEVRRLAVSATRLLASLAPGEALHQWMRLFVDYIATKKVIASALSSIVGATTDLYAQSGERIAGAMSLLVERAAAAGDIRPDVDPDDLLRALAGFTYGNASPKWQASALRLIDILMDGLRLPAR
jgi:AcrR family transcriptional regulator